MTGKLQYSTFFIDRFHFAIDVDQVQEVLQPMPLTEVPLTSEVIDGLVNLRGQIVPAINMRARLELPSDEGRAPSVSLIVRTQGGLVSLRVDQLGDVLGADALSPHRASDTQNRASDGGSTQDAIALEPLPDTVQGAVRDVTRGIVQLEDTLLLVLDPDQLLTADVSFAGES